MESKRDELVAALRACEDIDAHLDEIAPEGWTYLEAHAVGMSLGCQMYARGEDEDKDVMEEYGLSRQDLTDAYCAYTLGLGVTDEDFIEFLHSYTVEQACLLAGYAESLEVEEIYASGIDVLPGVEQGRQGRSAGIRPVVSGWAIFLIVTTLLSSLSAGILLVVIAVAFVGSWIMTEIWFWVVIVFVVAAFLEWKIQKMRRIGIITTEP